MEAFPSPLTFILYLWPLPLPHEVGEDDPDLPVLLPLPTQNEGMTGT